MVVTCFVSLFQHLYLTYALPQQQFSFLVSQKLASDTDLADAALLGPAARFYVLVGHFLGSLCSGGEE